MSDQIAQLIHTIGHSNLALAELCGIVSMHGISMVADVRRFPASRRHPRFARDVLRAALQEAGIGYAWFGRDLGGFRSGGYEAYMATDEFLRAVSALESLALQSPTAMLCAERDPAACHRRFIADELSRRGWRVVHLVGPDTGTVHVVQERLFP